MANVLKKIKKKINHYQFKINSKKTTSLIYELMKNRKKLSIYDIGAGNRYLKTLINFDGSANFNLIDPNRNLEWAVENLKKNLKYPNNVKSFRCGIGNKSGKKNFYLAATSTGSTFIDVYKNKNEINTKYFGEKNRIKVDIYNFKDFVKKFSLDKPDILKIDTEGYEEKIVEPILNNYKPYLIEIELNNNHPLYGDSFSKIHLKMKKKNYELVTFVPNYGTHDEPFIVGNYENPIYRSTVYQIDCIYINNSLANNQRKLSVFLGYGLIKKSFDVLKKINLDKKLKLKISNYIKNLSK